MGGLETPIAGSVRSGGVFGLATFFREWGKPALKCERLGHRTAVEWRRGYTKGDWRYVCRQETHERPACERCKAALGEWSTTQSKGFTGYSWPASMAERFERDGEIWQTGGFRPAAPAPNLSAAKDHPLPTPDDKEKSS